MTLSEHVRTLGRGPGRSRPLTQDEAYDAMVQMLEDDTAPEAVDTALILLRMKGETAAEIAGLVSGAQRALPTIPSVDLDWPSYAAGRTRGAPWFLLSAKLVAQAGNRVLVHGWNGHDEGLLHGWQMDWYQSTLPPVRMSLMRHKFNTANRHKFTKTRYRVTDWAAYNESLRRRGDLTIWITDESLGQWSAPVRTTRGGQPKYSNMVITMCLTLGVVYKLPLRQTQGLMRGIARIMGLEVPVPDFSTLSRRGQEISLSTKARAKRTEPVQLVVDSTGLKIFGEGEWLYNKHKTRPKCKSWRKLHLGLDLLSGEIICADLTTDSVGDPTALPVLLDQINEPVTRFIVDGAYDGTPTSDLLKARSGDTVKIIIPPPKNAICSPQSTHNPSSRDQHIAKIQTHGRLAWQVSSGYNQRSREETLMGRWKAVMGHKLKARRFKNQKTEVRIGAQVLNKMTELGRPTFVAVT